MLAVSLVEEAAAINVLVWVARSKESAMRRLSVSALMCSSAFDHIMVPVWADEDDSIVLEDLDLEVVVKSTSWRLSPRACTCAKASDDTSLAVRGPQLPVPADGW